MMQEQGCSSNSNPTAFYQVAPQRPDTELAVDTFNIDGQRWTFRTTPLRVRFEGRDGHAIANYADHTITVSTAYGPKMAARAAAEAMELVVAKVVADLRRRHPGRTIKAPPPYPTMPEILQPKGGR